MDSHIQFPKVILKQFADQNNILHYYSFEEMRNKRAYPKSFNTEKNYYLEETEQLFGAQIETHMGNILKWLNSETFYKETPYDNLVDHVKTYIYSLISRNPQFYNEVNNNSVFLQFVADEGKRDYIATTGISVGNDSGWLNGYKLGIATTDKTFTLNSYGVVQLYSHIICPVGLHRAFVLLKYIEPNMDSCIPWFDLTDETDIINQITFKYEYDTSRRFVIAENTTILTQLKNSI